ncbi:hypothetical protein N7478_002718 [Penicillium angulare]|uniref:uncharacterized protein n=1 Tax=Penicillium angulare TaxID=116970 RepID=UPI00253FD2CF|nr:uncharacterized protein N7478_002718 [Penicillium angulare]KAJ5287032.1 hypothetical protein N7478_002718 [Penicillium angulare]
MTQTSSEVATPNQFQQFITGCGDDPKRIQGAYETHRSNRNAQFKEILLIPGFREWKFDEVLEKILEADQGIAQYKDTRNNLSFWARPPKHIRKLVYDIQQEIASVAGPSLWLTPQEHLHLTTCEMVSASSAVKVDEVVETLQRTLPLETIVDYTLTHSPRLGRPVVSYDSTAFALSFVPAAEDDHDTYSYHHLRRDLWDIASKSGCQFASRYNVPSAHITIARFAVPPGEDKSKELDGLCSKANAIVNTIEGINQELRSTEWKRFGSPTRGEWVVGQERGLELNKGRSWYGKGDAVLIGNGF